MDTAKMRVCVRETKGREREEEKKRERERGPEKNA